MVVHEKSKLIYKNNIFEAKDIQDYIDNIKSILLTKDNIFDNVIAIESEKNPELIFAIFALMDLKIPFTIINRSVPKQRREYMRKKAGVSYTIVTDPYYGTSDSKIIKLDINSINNSTGSTGRNTVNCNYWSTIAYILFTSGTTGFPKGVEVTREGLANFIDSIPKIIEGLNNGKIASFINNMFDIFFLESIMALSIGMEVYLPDETINRNPAKYVEFLIANEIDTLQITPSMVNMLEMYDSRMDWLKNIKILMIGGEPFPEKILTKLSSLKNIRIYNMYGPTETTIWSTVAELTGKEKVNIGKPIANTEVSIRHDDGSLSKAGEIGEICISGVGLARGYVNDIPLTQRFFKNKNGSRYYCTGDLGKLNDDGYLEYIGRIDNQVKINGFRIELEEIESVILKYDGINDVCVSVKKTERSESLVAFVVKYGVVDLDKLKEFMRRYLPEYMIPSQIVIIREMKYTPNGKKDRKSLIEGMEDLFDTQNNREMKCDNRLENYIVNKLEFYLQGKFNMADTFENIGIDSLEYVSLITEIEDEFECEIPDDMLEITFFISVQEMINQFQKMFGQ
ncbi:AMP-binding protein [uncultured Eubacterium sp.]|uniref:AMP-binding protein n=1 Tax=uncultured Eubacterium sp. TaxID=165185 RepID=UPI002630F1D8|nr:AMP-binding protein [uncultured Eubacterium sp.]